MISMDASPWSAAVRKHLTEQKDLIPQAASRAAGRLAYQAVQDIRGQMKVTFRSPTPWTLNSVTHVEASTRSRSLQGLVPTDGSAAVVFRETLPGARQTGAGRYLYPQVYGGTRRQTRMERRLQMISPSGQTIYLIPTRYAEYDAAGNLASGWVTKVLSDVQALAGAGFNGNRRIGANRRRRVGTRYRDHQYFVIWPGSRSALPPAIYRMFNGGTHSRPVLAFSKRPPIYTPRLDLHRIVQNTVQRHAADFFFRALRRQLPAAPSSGT
jgi:hypothetical protein